MTKRTKHHLGITAALAIVAVMHFALPHDLKGYSPLFGFVANLLWIWSE